MKKILNGFIVIIMILILSGCSFDNSKNESVEPTIEYEDVYELVEEHNDIWDETTYYENYVIDENTGLVISYDSYQLSSKNKVKNRKSFSLEYDDNGNKIKSIEESTYVITRKYEYNEHNDIIKFIYKSSKDNKEKLYTYEYLYDDLNRKIKYIEHWDDGTTYETTYEYNDSGLLSKKVDSGDDYYTAYYYTYDDEGKVITEVQENDSSYYKIDYVYDDNNNVIKKKMYKNKSALVTYTDTFKYEIVGRKIKTT